jgi:hypothetical protein
MMINGIRLRLPTALKKKLKDISIKKSDYRQFNYLVIFSIFYDPSK